MTQSPFGGPATPSGPQVASSATPSTDFGATTISGSSTSNPPLVTGTRAPSQESHQQPHPFQNQQHSMAAAPTATPTDGRGARYRGPRRARLQLRHISPLTVLKFSCVLAIALFFVWLIVIGVLYGVLDAAGVISNINDSVIKINGSGSKPPITAGVVFGGAAIIGVVNIVLFVALTTIGSVIYNLCADLVGGIEITLSER
jgi:hypothetical protein